jgi:ornithine carbamoyltransferase
VQRGSSARSSARSAPGARWVDSAPVEKDYLSVDDLSPGELSDLLALSGRVKADPEPYRGALTGRAVALIFEKPSTRTRVSFEVGVEQLGAYPVVLSSGELQLGRGETIEDTGRVLSRYVDAIVLRTFEQERLEVLAEAASVPVVNSLSDFEHPCQALADLFTVREWYGDPAGRVLTYLGDGNNVAHSLLLAGAKAGMTVRVATPPGFEPIPQVVHRAEEIATETGGAVEVGNDPEAAASGAHALYTDVWASMGQEDETDERGLIFPAYQLGAKLLELAQPDAIVLHCLPAHRGQEITAEVIDGPRSAVWDQAENRLHTQKALLLRLFGAA